MKSLWRDSGRHTAVLGASALLCAPALVGVLLVIGGCTWGEVVLCTFCAAAVVPVALPWLLQRPFDAFHPMAWVSLSVLLGTVLRSLYLALFETEKTAWLLDYRPIEELFPGALVICAGTACIGLGYALLGARRARVERIRILNRTWSLPRLRILFWIVAVVSFVATADFLRRTGFDMQTIADISSKRRVHVSETTRDFASLGYHRWAAHALMVPLFYMFVILWIGEKDKRAKRLALVSGACSIAFPFLVSNRSGVGFVLIGVLMAIALLRNIPYGRIVAAAFCLLVVFGVMRGMRNDELQDASYLSRMVGEGKMLEDIVANRNFVGITKTTRIFTDTPEKMEREYGMTFMLWAIAWVPRTMWPAKPEISVGDRVTHEIFQEAMGGGYPPGLIGELIINFGLLGMLVGCCAYGAGLRYFYNSFRPVLRRNPTLLLVYLLVVVEISFVLMGLQVARIVMNLLKSFITAGVFVWLASARRPRVASIRLVPEVAS
jgi:hypothetical protein